MPLCIDGGADGGLCAHATVLMEVLMGVSVLMPLCVDGGADGKHANVLMDGQLIFTSRKLALTCQQSMDGQLCPLTCNHW
eukprot:9003118-Lingulodinium_polyedra.AAC.1